MPQLPSVSELLIGAQNPASAESRTTPQQVIRKLPSATSVRSETSPRQAEFLLGPQPAPAAHPGSAARHVRVPLALQSFSGPAHVHAPESHFHAHPGSIKDAFVFSAASSGRNLISSVVLDPHGHGPHGQMQAPVFAPDYFSYREGYRSRHALLQLLLPHLQYKPRQESSAGSHTRAPLYHSMPSQESLVTTLSRLPGADHSPTFYAHSRPASFSHASGPGVAYAPAGPTMGPAMGPALGPALGQYGSQMPPMYQQQAPHGAPGGAAPQPLAYYNSATAGSGYPAGFHAGQDASAGFHTGAQASPRTLGSYGGNYGQEHFAHPHPQAQFQMPGMPAPAPMPMQMPAYQMEGMAPGQGMLPRQAHHQYAPPGGSDMQQLATDPNHALINKRCIIKRRTRTGCLTCRKRRIKCDERKPHCFNCERLKKLCLGYEALPSKPGQSRKSSECSPALSPTETEHPSDIAHGQTLSDGHHASHVVKHMPRVSVNDLL